MRALGLLDRTERELRAAGAEATIHGLWVALVDRADTPDQQAAAALAGRTMRLVGVG